MYIEQNSHTNNIIGVITLHYNFAWQLVCKTYPSF